MKKLALALLTLLGLVGLYWTWPGPAPDLPELQDLSRVEMTPSEPLPILMAETYPIVLEDEKKLQSLLDYWGQASQTRQESVNDSPTVIPHVQFVLVDRSGNSQTYFIYQDGGQTYLEAPYQAIYRLKQPLETWLAAD